MRVSDIYAIIGFHAKNKSVIDEHAVVLSIDNETKKVEIMSKKGVDLKKIESIDIAFMISRSKSFFVCSEATVRKEDGNYVYTVTVPDDKTITLPNGKTYTLTNKTLKTIFNLLKPKKMKKENTQETEAAEVTM